MHFVIVLVLVCNHHPLGSSIDHNIWGVPWIRCHSRYCQAGASSKNPKFIPKLIHICNFLKLHVRSANLNIYKRFQGFDLGT